MSSEFDPAIDRLQKELGKKEDEIISMKQMINQLCIYANRPSLYAEAELKRSSARVFRPDQFYKKPLATAVREVLDMRHVSGAGPATVREIYGILVEGGYAFDTQIELNAIRGLRVSLSKNTSIFHKLPNGQFGLVAWYPKLRLNKNKADEELLGNDNEHNSDDNSDEQSDSTNVDDLV